MNLINREGLYVRVALGVIAGVVTIVFFNMDHKEVLAPFNARNSAFNYSMIIIMFYILFLMNFIAGLKREYEVSISYIVFMVAYDLVTEGLVTILFASLSFISLLIGATTSVLAKRLGIIKEK